MPRNSFIQRKLSDSSNLSVVFPDVPISRVSLSHFVILVGVGNKVERLGL